MNPLAAIESKITSFDLSKAIEKFETYGKKKALGVAKFKLDGSQTTLLLEGTICTNGICVNEFSNGKVYSIGLTLNNDEEYAAFNRMEDYLAGFAGGNFSLTNVVKDEVIYLKLRLANDKKSFLVKSNQKLDPRKAADFPMSGQEVKVTVDLNAYFNFADEKTGLVLGLKELDFI